MSLTCIFVGDESLLIQCASLLQKEGHGLSGIVTSSPSIRSWADTHGIATFEADSAGFSAISRLECDVLFSVANLRVLPPDVIQLPTVAAVNFHDGPLPERAGLNVTTWAIHDGERSHGVTWHLMTQEVDRGEVVATRRFDIEDEDTVFDLNVKCYEAAIDSFSEVLERVCEFPIITTPQEGQGTLHLRAQRPPGAALMNWDENAEQLHARIRSLDFGTYANPIASPKLLAPNGDVLYFNKAKLEEKLAEHPGTVLSVGVKNVVVAAADKAIRISGLSNAEGVDVDLASTELEPGVVLPILSTDEFVRLNRAAERFAVHERYWQRQLEAYVPTSTPYEKTSSTKPRANEAGLSHNVENLVDVKEALVSSGVECSMEDALVVAFVLFLCRLGAHERVSVGLSHDRCNDLLNGLPNVFASCIPFSVDLEQGIEVAEARQKAMEALLATYKRATYANDLILRSPDIGDAPTHSIILDLVGSQIDSALVVRHAGDCKVQWLYDASIYDAESIESLQSQFALFVAQLAFHSNNQLASIDILSPEVRQELLVTLNDTEIEFDESVCIHELFEAQVEIHPDKMALHSGDDEWTYAELNLFSNQVARALRDEGVSPGDLVGVHIERSAWMVAALIGVLKSGAAYVPLDPQFPANRLAFMVEDAGLAAVIADSTESFGELGGAMPVLTADSISRDAWARENPSNKASSSDLAYVLYTSGSTGRPKGVMVEHRNVINFFDGMDERVDTQGPGVWLAVTSISFDISVLELFWTLTRGFTIVIQKDETDVATRSAISRQPMAFSLFYFASDEGGESAADKYKLLLEGTKYGDENGFEAVWTPERHFHAFGGLYPNPSVASAALSTITSNIQLRAGSCVSPLHHPARIAEEWSVVDNLSGGRVGISFAAGWQPNDFVLRPESFEDRKERMFDQIETVQALWRGETLEFEGPKGDSVSVRTLPRPVQAELPVWITAASNPETFREAGEKGYHVLTHLLGQRVEDLAQKIEIYREARRLNGHDAQAGSITLMLHTFVGEDTDSVRELVREPMKAYLKSSIGLIKEAAWSFPTFRKQTTGDNGQFSVEHLSEEALNEVLDFSFERYYETSALFGDVETCAEMVEQLKQIGVDEIACLIDYGLPTDAVLPMLPVLNRLKERMNSTSEITPTIQENLNSFDITHLQCTPTQASLLASDPDTLGAMSKLEHLLIGGEALSSDLAGRLSESGVKRITNMYGPTETTIWSATHPVSEGESGTVPLGRPISNTSLYVLDDQMQPVSLGMTGELWIGGAGVARGYHNRPDLTADKFKENPFGKKGRIYRTGDLVKYNRKGVLEFQGRADFQVKLRGFRIELGEIEIALGTHPDVREAAVVVREDTPGDQRLVGYYTLMNGRAPARQELRGYLSNTLPDYMIPSTFVKLDALPLTPNRKLDRRALPDPSRHVPERASFDSDAVATDSNVEKELLDIWKDVLNIDAISSEDNFFDLGGHSLLAMQVQSRLKEMHGYAVRIVDLFRFPTVRALAKHLGSKGEEGEVVTVNKGADRGARRAALMKNRTRASQ